jgi:hypothetical protein
MRMIR